ncbi:MAG: bifunctional diaminohydroxyphosphoribosylaminopyrimidine deaminase/5-amino-6-(5-phosphoribosylamino)uracil reductase RibD [Rhodospirillales bacterium]
MSNNTFSAADRGHMATALALGRRGLGRVWPNPAVGCVIVDKVGIVAGRGWTQPGGRPHAETEALLRAGARAKGGTAYVTLEPCSHVGETAPCAEALIAAGISRVVAALEDPDGRVSGRGFDILRQAGIKVEVGLDEKIARFDQAGFLSRIERGRPMIALKTATSLDGRIAAKTGDSKWITGPEARKHGHLLRATHDAILVGVGTALADNPRLDCRIAGFEGSSPIRIVLDTRLKLAEHSDLDLVARANEQETWVFTASKDLNSMSKMTAAGVRVFPAPIMGDGRLDVASVSEIIASEGVTRLLIEGGATLATSFLERSLVDRIHSFRGPQIIGGDGLAAIGPLGLVQVANGPRFIRQGLQSIDDDCAEFYVTIE